MRPRDFRGDVNLENSDRLDEMEGGCESDGVAFAHMSGCCDVFDAKNSSGGAKGSELLDGGHVLSRSVRTCDAQGSFGGLGTNLYSKYPAYSRFSVAVCTRMIQIIRSRSGCREVHSLQVWGEVGAEQLRLRAAVRAY